MAFTLCLWSGAFAQSTSSSFSPQILPTQNVDLDGSLTVIAEDLQASHQLEYFLTTADQRLQLRFTGGDPAALVTGMHVTVHGKVLGTDMYVASPTDINQVGRKSLAPAGALSLSSALTFGDQSTLVLLVNFQDDTSQPFDPAVVSNVVFNSADQFYREVSQNQTWISGTVFSNWITVPLTSHVCDFIDLALLADQKAKNAGANFLAYRHIVYFFNTTACSFTGAASLNGNRIWMNGNTKLEVFAEEMGHNLGLYRSHGLNCGTAPTGPVCTKSETGDLFDVMSGSIVAHFNAFQKERLGYLNFGTSLPITTVTTSGTHDVSPYESTTPTSKALKIITKLDPALGYNNLFYVEYRQLLGFDNSLQLYPDAVSGVLIHQTSSVRTDTSYLIDMHPETPVFDDAALQVGESFTDDASGVNITLLSADNTHASIKVSMGGDTCAAHIPVVTIAPTGFTGVPGSAAPYIATIKNTDEAACGTTAFTLSNSVPTDWVGTLNKTSLSLAPGTTGTANFVVTSSNTASGGRYRVFVGAKNDVSALSAAGATNYDVLAPFSVAVTPGSVTASQGGSAVASVTTTVNPPFSNGIQLSVSGLPTGVTGTFNPALFSPPGSGKSTLTLAAASDATPGIYSLIISGVGGGSTQVASLTLSISPSGDFSLTASPVNVSVVKGSSNFTTITTAKTGTFSSAIALSVSNPPANLTAVLNPVSISAPGNGTSTLTFSASASATVGNTFTFTVTGTGGNATHTATVNVTIVASAPTPPPGGDVTVIPRTGWKLLFADSTEGQCGMFPGTFAFDGNASTYWLTQSCLGAAALPHELRIDLGKSYSIGGFKYLPRQDAGSLGKVKNFRFYVSADGKTWGDPLAESTLITDPADKAEKQVLFTTLGTGRYVRFVALSEVNGGQATSIAELNVLEATTPPGPPPPPPPPPPSENDFVLTSSQASLTVTQGSKITTTITSTLNGSFSSKIFLSASGMPMNLVPSFSPTSIAAPGSGQSILTFDTDGVPLGSYPISITGTAGAVIHSITVTLNINAPNPPPPGLSLISQLGWKLKYVDSQEAQCSFHLAQYAFDSRMSTFWQSASCIGSAPMPHEIQIDLGSVYNLKGFRYLPRQDGQALGKIKQYEFYVSTDGVAWGTPVTSGDLITLPNDSTEKQIIFDATVSGRYVKLKALSEVNGGKVASMAELNLLQ